MDSEVEKFLEGKTDEEKFLAIAYSFRCLLTRPQCDSAPDPPMIDEPVAKKKVNREPKYSFEEFEVSDKEDSSDEPMTKNEINREPTYSFGQVSGKEDSSDKPIEWKKINRHPKYSFGSFRQMSDEEDSSDEPIRWTNVNRHPKYSSEKVSGKEDSSEQNSPKGNAGISKQSLHLALNHRRPPLPNM